MDTISIPYTLRELSHELRTPLTGLLGNIDLLGGEVVNPALLPYINDIRESSYQLFEVINRLLLESHKIKLG